MNEREVMAILINLGNDSHMTYASTVASTAKEDEVARLEISPFHPLAIVHLQAGTPSKVGAKRLKDIAGKS